MSRYETLAIEEALPNDIVAAAVAAGRRDYQELYPRTPIAAVNRPVSNWERCQYLLSR